MRPDDRIDDWLSRLIARHTAELSTPELLKAVRALSARYVERRDELSRRPPIDSAGKRAAFAAFYAPIHFFTAREILAALDAPREAASQIVDLGCGTGVAAAAWALHASVARPIVGIDKNPWSLAEAAWNWRTLDLAGRTRRADMVVASGEMDSARGRLQPGAGVILGWSANELDGRNRDQLLRSLLGLVQRGASVLVIEPLARVATPWWDTWANRWLAEGGRADIWKFDVPLPPALATLSEAAGFRRDTLGARTLWAPARR